MIADGRTHSGAYRPSADAPSHAAGGLADDSTDKSAYYAARHCMDGFLALGRNVVRANG